MNRIPGKRLFGPLGRFVRTTITQVAEINRKYSQPRIKTTRAVTFALLALRLYLLLMVVLLFYKFITSVLK